MKLSKTLAAAALLGLALFAPSESNAADKIRVGMAAIYPAYGVCYAAEQLGFYKEKNLEVELTTFRSGPIAQEALAAGAIDVITISPPGAAVAISKGIKEKIVAPTGDLTPEGWHLVVLKDSPIQSLKDLQGKSVGVSSKASTMDFLALWAARQGGVTIKTVPLGTPGVLPALKAKQIDATVLWPLVSYASLVSGETRSIADFGRDMDPVLPDTWGASLELITGHPDALRRWLEANSKAILYMQNNRDWALTFLKHYTDEKDDRVIAMTYDAIIKHLRADGTMNPQWMVNSLKLATDAGLSNIPSAEQIFDRSFTPIKVSAN